MTEKEYLTKEQAKRRLTFASDHHMKARRDWFWKLIGDIKEIWKDIRRDVAKELIKGKWLTGKRILPDYHRFGRVDEGDVTQSMLADELGVSRRQVGNIIRFSEGIKERYEGDFEAWWEEFLVASNEQPEKFGEGWNAAKRFWGIIKPLKKKKKVDRRTHKQKLRAMHREVDSLSEEKAIRFLKKLYRIALTLKEYHGLPENTQLLKEKTGDIKGSIKWLIGFILGFERKADFMLYTKNRSASEPVINYKNKMKTVQEWLKVSRKQ